MLYINQACGRHGGAEGCGFSVLKAQLVVGIGFTRIKRTTKTRMSTNKEGHVLTTFVGYLVGHLDGSTAQLIARGNGKGVGVLLEQLGMVCRRKAHGQLALPLLREFPLLLAGKAVARKLDFLARRRYGTAIAQTAAHGKADGSLPRPYRRVALPEIFATVCCDGGKRASCC